MDISALAQDDYTVEVPFMEDAFVTLRYVSREELLAVYRKARTVFIDQDRRKAEEYDPIQADVILGRAAVRGWRGITMEGRDYPYSPENCDFLMRKWHMFAKFVSGKCADIQALVRRERDETVKN